MLLIIIKIYKNVVRLIGSLYYNVLMSVLAIIGGSGLYDLKKLGDSEELDMQTAWGKPSDKILELNTCNKTTYFLPRHGRGHNINPSNINYRANIDALKQLGVTDIVSISAVGSLKKEIEPGSFVIINQYIDKTFKRTNTFFDEDLIAHVSLAKPNSASLEKVCSEILTNRNYDYHENITYVAIEGPQLSTIAESRLHHIQGFDVVGMTNMPEARIAREAEIRYQSIGMVTDYDAYNLEDDFIDVSKIIEVMKQMTGKAENIIKDLIESYDMYSSDDDPILTCLDQSIVSDLDKVSNETKQDLSFILRRYMKKKN